MSLQLGLIIMLFGLNIVNGVTKDFRHISAEDLETSIQLVPLDGVFADSQILFDVARNQMFVGARDAIHRLELSKLNVIETSRWEAPNDKRRACMEKGQDEDKCHNYVKILLTNGRQLFACGTNAFAPICTWRNIGNLTVITRTMDGVAKCPYCPHANVTGLLADNYEYFFGGPTDFSNSDSLISKNINGAPLLRTKQYNSFWLNDPQFVYSFETAEFAYFLYRETAVEYINCGKVIYSRIARVCKNDQGGNITMLRDNWTTFIKARLNCSASGDYPFYYNEIQSAHYIAEEKVFYATFTTPDNSIAGSAICAFNMSAVDEVFNGPFKYQNDMNSAWMRHDSPNKDHLKCKQSSYSSLLETARYQLMDNAVQATTINPIHVADLQRFTHITVDITTNKYNQKIHVIFLATQEGVIKKLTVLPNHHKACIVELWHLKSIKTIKFLKSTNSIYATTNNGIMKIPAGHCQRFTTMQSCLNAMDPYCGWNELQDRCTSGQRHEYWKQHLNSCPVLTTPINGGWSVWSNWELCNQSKGDGDECMCQTRQCNNPPPANNGEPCTGPSVAVTNCTVHGGWTAWSAYSTCSATCGIALKSRFRTCTNPTPAFAGRVCVGQDRNEVLCTELPPCPIESIDGQWSSWSPWSGCSPNSCNGFRTRRRRCDNPAPTNGGRACIGNDIEYDTCSEHCKETKLIHTTDWITDHNISIRHYHQKRFKIMCKAPVRFSQQIKIVVKDENQVCHSNKCENVEEHGSWGPWGECSASCGGGNQSRHRFCKGGCQGPNQQSRDCNKHPCEEEWGCWSDWSPCNVSCGWGVRTRSRKCLATCHSLLEMQKQACYESPCDNAQGWGNWSYWSSCDELDLQYRKRICLDSHTCHGASIESRMCVGNTMTNEIRADGMHTIDCGCTKSNISLFLIGFIAGLFPFGVYLWYSRHKLNEHKVPSSPHYITKSNSYVTIQGAEKMQLKNKISRSGSVRTNFNFDFSSLKRNSKELKNTKEPNDDYLYE